MSIAAWVQPDHTVSPDPTVKRRLPELDALRGVAAVTVVLLHFRDMWNLSSPGFLPNSLRHLLDVLGPLYSGSEAVILFFVLSGFVLTLPYCNGKAQAYPAYLLRRVIRIYGPYLCALLLSLVGAAIWHNHPFYGEWAAHTMWAKQLTLVPVLEHIVLIGPLVPIYFFVAWSLKEEIRVSIIFPAVVRGTRRLGNVGCLLLVPLSAIPFVLAGGQGYSLSYDLLFSIHIAGIFVLGILLADNQHAIGSWWRNASSLHQISIAISSFILYGYSPRWTSYLQRLIAHSSAYNPLQNVLHNLITAVGALGIVILALNAPPFRNALNSVVGHFIGRISYSLYLLHPIVLFAIRFGLGNRVSWILQLPIYLLMAFLVSWLFCLYVEEPWIRLGRRLR